MNDQFDELANGMAQTARCRQALRRCGAGLALLTRTLLGVAVIALFAGPATANDFRRGPLIDLSDPDALAACGSNGAEKETSVAVNSTDPNNIVAIWWGGLGSGIVTAVTLDGGKKWQQVVVPGVTLCAGGNFAGAVDPWVSFAPNGDLYQISLAFDRPPISPHAGILVSKSTDGGLHWGKPVTLFETADQRFLPDKPSITADPTDARFAYAAWDRSDNGNRGAGMFTRTTDSGQTWEAVRAIYDPSTKNNGTIGHQIIVLPNGVLVDSFTEFKNSDTGANKDAVLSVIRSTDKGQTWTAPVRAAIVPIFDANDPDTGFPVINAGSFPPLFGVAVDSHNGNLYAVWEDTRFSGGQYGSIAFAQSTDGGFTWSEPIRLNKTPDNIAPANRQAFLPSVAVAADSTIGVTYYDFRFNDPNAGLPTDSWLVYCHPAATTPANNPASWGNEVRLTDTSFDMEKTPTGSGAYFVGDYEALATAGNDFLPVWSQPRDMDPDSVFFRRVGR